MDFTIDIYTRLLDSLHAGGYSFQTVENFIRASEDKAIILRHDVDRIPENALKLAKLEHELGIGSTYYFRAVQESWDEDIIKQIAEMGHEIGYHYENLSEISKISKEKGVSRLRKATACQGGWKTEDGEIRCQTSAIRNQRTGKDIEIGKGV